jgi:uroporphyrinogen-III synthase
MAGLARQLLAQLDTPTTIALATADRGGRDLERLLEPAGHVVRRVAVYATLPTPTSGSELPPLTGLDAVVLGSPSALEGLTNQRAVPSGLPVITLGPTTSAAARAAGLDPVVEATGRDLDGIAAALASLAKPGS